MSTLTLRRSGGGWLQTDGKRVLAIAAVTVMHLLLLGQLLLPQTPAPLRMPPAPEFIPVPIERPPPPVRPPDPPPVQITRQPQLPTPPIRVAAAPVQPVPVAASTAHTEQNDEPPATITPYQPPAAPANRAPAMESLVVLRSPPPIYPRFEESRGIGGTVKLRILVGTNGRPLEVIVQTSSGNRKLDTAAVRAVERGWRFQPSTVDGRAVERWGVVSIRFTPGS